jgi:hypothetical protein
MAAKYVYHCRGPMEPHPTLPPRQSGVARPHDKAVAFVDDADYERAPLLNRPQFKALDAVLAAGDELTIAMGEFLYLFPDMASSLRGIARWLRDLDARGIDVSFVEAPVPADLSREAANLSWAQQCETWAESYDTWAAEAGGYDAWADQTAEYYRQLDEAAG